MNTEKARAPSMRSGDLAAEVVQDVQRLINLEVALAKQELKELAITNAIAVVCFAAAGLMGVVALLVGGPVVVVMPVARPLGAGVGLALAHSLIASVLAPYGRAR